MGIGLVVQTDCIICMAVCEMEPGVNYVVHGSSTGSKTSPEIIRRVEECQ